VSLRLSLTKNSTKRFNPAATTEEPTRTRTMVKAREASLVSCSVPSHQPIDSPALTV
jgi:hypothetical protein